ncbi:uncharacterized protein [Panulirus ornatus]|uniref:uncharacterized protein isoform X2 n=1 Tax=Panulirus ornatus TaxID=150431 RepID=UPI003A8618E8
MNGKQSISGPYRATKLWNDAVRSFYNGMPVSRHWRGLRQYDKCFTAIEAIDWLHNHLQNDPNFGNSVSRDQTIKLLRKFLKSGLIEDVRGSTARPDDFKDNRELYRFSNRSPLKALRTPRTPGRSVLGTLNSNTSNNRQNQDEGASPVLKRRSHGSVRESTKGIRSEDAERERGGSLRTKIKPRRVESLHSGENAVNEVKDHGGMQECHLIAKQLSKAEINDVWKHVLLGKLDSLCERLLFGEASSVLDPKLVEGEWVHHNVTKITPRGVVQAPESHPDDLPNWILTAMKCLAHWPSLADSSCNIPNYPGVEKDVFKIVRDFFTNLVTPLIPYELYESFIRIYIGAEFLDITYRSPKSIDSTSSSAGSHNGSYEPDLNDNDSVDDLMLNMSICGQQKTSTPNTENENNVNDERQGIRSSVFRRQGSNRSLGSARNTPSVRCNTELNSSKLQSLKLRRLKNYTDFKEDNLYPTLLEGSREGSCLGLSSENQENMKPLRHHSRLSQELLMQKQPETVRSVKTNDHARRVRRENDGKEVNSDATSFIRSKQIDGFALPENCCFETAFTSDSPKTRIIPQKSVDSLHFKNGDRSKITPKQRPKSIAVPSVSTVETRIVTANLWDNSRELKNVSTVSDLFKSSILSNSSGEYVTASALSPLNRSRSAGNLESLTEDGVTLRSSNSVSAHNVNEIVPSRSLASRIRDSIKRKHIRDDSLSRKRNSRGRDSRDQCKNDDNEQALDHLRTKSGGYINLVLAPGNVSQEDIGSIRSCTSDYQELGPRLNHLRTKSGGFLNLALVPSNDSVHLVDNVNTFPGPLTTHSDLALPGHQRQTVASLHGYARTQECSAAPRTDCIRRRITTPDGCLSHSLSSSSSGCSGYHSALSHSSRNSTPNLLGPPVPPRAACPVSGIADIYSVSQSQEPLKIPNYENVPDLSKQLSSSANELSDRWADRTPYGQVPPYAQGGVWRHYHSSPSKRLIGRRKGIEFFYGSKACLPGLLTKEGKDIAVSSLQLLLLLLAPVRRRKLHLLLRMMSKMSSNDKLTLDPEQTTRALVLNTFTRSILLCDQEADYDEILSLRIVSFLMDNHEEMLRPPQDLSVLVHRRLNQIQRRQIVYGSTIEDRSMTFTYCRQVSHAQYEHQRLTGSQQYLAQLLDQIVDNKKLSAKAKKKKLKEFKSLYPEVYKVRFPDENRKTESRSKMRSLMKLASFSSLGKGRALRV